ncbi:hypothetical protein LB505_006694 [Fusarium chuoi]|nr:hypothetical protein LB505_006694 [Fusarium chuoi]
MVLEQQSNERHPSTSSKSSRDPGDDVMRHTQGLEGLDPLGNISEQPHMGRSSLDGEHIENNGGLDLNVWHTAMRRRVLKVLCSTVSHMRPTDEATCLVMQNSHIRCKPRVLPTLPITLHSGWEIALLGTQWARELHLDGVSQWLHRQVNTSPRSQLRPSTTPSCGILFSSHWCHISTTLSLSRWLAI